jgi:hypothetical protein
MKENTTYLYLVDTPCQRQIRVSIECDDRKTHEGSQEARAPAHEASLRAKRKLAALDAHQAPIRSISRQLLNISCKKQINLIWNTGGGKLDK